MQKQKWLGLAAAVALVMGSSMARADDATAASTSAHDQCINDCTAQCDQSTGAGTTVTPKAKKHAMNTGSGSSASAAATPGAGGSAHVNVNVNPGAAAQCPAADLDQIRSEERARASEEFQSEEQKLNADHQAELDKVRADAAADASRKSEADIAAARAEEDRKLESRRITEEKTSAGPLNIQKAALTPIGVYGQVGGGYMNFTQPTTSAVTNGGGFWDARLGVGSRSIIGLEADYQGGAQNITALGLNNSAYLMDNGIDGLVRLNVPVTMAKSIVEPYAFGGAGWTNYHLMNVRSNTSDVASNDNVLDVPVGGGLQIGYAGVTLDGRVTYRQTFFTDLLGHTSSSFASNSLNNWGAGATLGFEF